MDRLIPMMRWATVATVMLAAVAALGQKDQSDGMTMSIPGSLPDIHLVSPVANGQWTMQAGDYGNLRYSPLSQINTQNVHSLHVVANISDGIPHGHEGGPLVVGSTMYMVTPYPNNLMAFDLSKPEQHFPMLWKYMPHPSIESVGVACCDTVNRGPMYADGKIIYALLDAHVVAVDARSGKEVWRTQVGDIHFGETTTMAPLVVKDTVFVGNSGGELGVRGKLTALDVKTGKVKWIAWSTGSDQDVRLGPDFKPFYAKDQGKDLGLKTWNPGQWKIGGGTIWGWISYDPQLNLIYYGTGNPGPWNPDMRPGDNKWTCSIIARDADTGMAKWAWQGSPHDEWDYDEIMENILVDMPWKGQMRKLLIHPGRTGFMYVLDRTNGEILSASQYEPTNWATGYDLKTGKAQMVEEKETHFGRFTKHICPSSTGAKDFIPSSFDPRTGYVYIPAHNTCMDYMGTAVNYIAGTPYLGAEVRMYPGPGGYQGELVAWDVKEGKRVWSVQDPDLPVYSGVLSTGGDVVFYGTMEGWFRAVDAHSGKILWQYKCPSGIVSDPITFTGPDGKQYVAVYSGVGGWMGATAFPSVSTDDPYAALGVVGTMKKIKTLSPPGDMLYVFSL